MLLNPGFVKQKKADTAGFSIIECLIALSIFSIGILAIATLILSSIGANASARRITEATALAEARLEQVMALPYDNIVAGESTQSAYTVVWDVTEDVIVAKTKSITVTVSWWYRGRQRGVTVRHLFSQLA
jgi:prepilin-type N-terminal cleavage/methylation domain-containing protein